MRVWITLVLFCYCIRACCATTSDLLFNWSLISTGNLTTANLANGIVGSVSSATVDTGGRWSVVNTNGSTPAFPSAVTCNGTNWSGVGTNWLQNNCNTGEGSKGIYFNLNVNPLGCMLFGFVQMSVTNANDDSNNQLDQWVLYKNSTFAFSVFQVQPGSATDSVRCHASTPGSSANVAVGSATFGTIYFVELIQDTPNNRAHVRFYNGTAPYSLVGSNSIATETGQNTDYQLQMLSGYLYDFPGTVRYGPIAMINAPTWAQIDGVITNGATTNYSTNVLFGHWSSSGKWKLTTQ